MTESFEFDTITEKKRRRGNYVNSLQFHLRLTAEVITESK